MKPHGTTARYHAGCRCSRCRAALAAYKRDQRRGILLGRTRGGRTHGRIATYNDGCRCAQCRDAARLARARHRAKRRAAA